MHSAPYILAKFLEQCTPEARQGAWLSLATDPDIYRGPDYPIATIARLHEHFTEAELLATGVARADHDGAGLLPAPSWSNPGSLLVALRRRPGEAPFDILSDGGSFSGNPALLSSLRDSNTISAIEEEDGFLLVAGAINDLFVLRSAGLPVTLASGILPLDRAKLDSLIRARVLRRCGEHALHSTDEMRQARSHEHSDRVQNADRADANAELPQLNFVAWSPGELSLEEPPFLAQIRAELGAVGEHLRIDVSEIFEWTPTIKEFNSLRFCLEFGESERACQILKRSIDSNSAELTDGLGAVQASDPPDFENAFSNLQHSVMAFRVDKSHTRLQTALDEYISTVERELLEPLRLQGLAYRSPLRRNLYVVAAEICRQLHHRSHWAKTAEELLGHKSKPRDGDPESFLRAAGALARLAGRLLA